jgi:serine kinase of HPr protein (carbohydrate metabolism regulator)
MSDSAPPPIHATCIALGGRGVVLRGPSGAGKSDLALRLINRGAMLVADDWLCLEPHDTALIARAPANLRGLLEVRGLGIIRLPYLRSCQVHLVVDLVDPMDVPRLPEGQTLTLSGIALPLLRLHAFEESSPIKIALSLGRNVTLD